MWGFFQLEDICEVGQPDASIREALRNLPMGLAETYRRILNKIEQRSPRINEMAQKMLKWVVCARRPLLLDELKEAITFGPGDQTWDNDKIPVDTNGKRFVQICGNLALLDGKAGTVRLAHHTIKQYLISTPKADGLHRFQFHLTEAQLYAGEVCVTYLLFSDFETQITRSNARQLATSGILDPAGLSYIPSVLGYGRKVFDLWYRLRGGDVNQKSPQIDYTPMLMLRPNQKKAAGSSIYQKYHFLNYTIESWVFHTSLFSADNTSLWGSFRSLALEKTLPFDFRDWNSSEGPAKIAFWALYQWASREGHGPLIRLLQEPSALHPQLHTYLEHDLDLDEKLLHCAGHGHADVLQQLLQCHRGQVGTRAEGTLKAGVQNGDEAIVRLVLKDGSRLATSTALNGSLFCATRNGRTRLVLILLEHGAQFQVGDLDGRTALHTAAVYGHEPIARALLKAGADIETRTTGTTKTALTSATGADIETRPIDKTKITLASADIFMTLTLGDNFESFEPEVTSGETDYSRASSHAREAFIQTSPERAVKTCARSEEEETALHLAAREGHVTLVKLLVDSGAEIEARTMLGETALLLAASCGHKEVVQMLLELGANVNECCYKGYTALHYATIYGHTELVQLLADSGASLGQGPSK